MDAETATIRRATPHDAEALTELVLALGFWDGLTFRDVVRRLEGKLEAARAPSHTLLVAESDA